MALRAAFRQNLSSNLEAAVLLNIDKKHRTSVLHANDCKRIPRPHGTSYKPVGRLGRDGGWFAVDSEVEGRTTARERFPTGEFIRCQNC